LPGCRHAMLNEVFNWAVGAICNLGVSGGIHDIARDGRGGVCIMVATFRSWIALLGLYRSAVITHLADTGGRSLQPKIKRAPNGRGFGRGRASDNLGADAHPIRRKR
jgi:hypothetical protein